MMLPEPHDSNLMIADLPDELAELKAIEAESIGWIPLGDGAYLHAGQPNEEETIITVVGVMDASMAGINVLWVG